MRVTVANASRPVQQEPSAAQALVHALKTNRNVAKPVMICKQIQHTAESATTNANRDTSAKKVVVCAIARVILKHVETSVSISSRMRSTVENVVRHVASVKHVLQVNVSVNKAALPVQEAVWI